MTMIVLHDTPLLEYLSEQQRTEQAPVELVCTSTLIPVYGTDIIGGRHLGYTVILSGFDFHSSRSYWRVVI